MEIIQQQQHLNTALVLIDMADHISETFNFDRFNFKQKIIHDLKIL